MDTPTPDNAASALIANMKPATFVAYSHKGKETTMTLCITAEEHEKIAGALKATVTALEAEVDRLREDARRYRYLRDQAHPDSDTGEAVTRQELGDWGKWYTQHLSGGLLDAVIDNLTGARAK